MRHGLQLAVLQAAWLANPNIYWELLTCDALWSHVTDGNFCRFSEATDSPLAEPLTADKCLLCKETEKVSFGNICHSDTPGQSNCPGWWNMRLVMMPVLSSLVALQVVMMTTSGAASDSKVGIMINQVSQFPVTEIAESNRETDFEIKMKWKTGRKLCKIR